MKTVKYLITSLQSVRFSRHLPAPLSGRKWSDCFEGRSPTRASTGWPERCPRCETTDLLYATGMSCASELQSESHDRSVSVGRKNCARDRWCRPLRTSYC